MASQSSKNSPKKPKLVRDSFTIPKSEFIAIEALKTRAIALGTSVKKSELLRAGLMVLQGLSDTAYKTALAAVPTLKTGRPTVAAKPEEPAPPTPKAPARKPPAKAPVRGVARKPAAKPVAKAPAKKAATARKPAAARKAG